MALFGCRELINMKAWNGCQGCIVENGWIGCQGCLVEYGYGTQMSGFAVVIWKLNIHELDLFPPFDPILRSPCHDFFAKPFYGMPKLVSCV